MAVEMNYTETNGPNTDAFLKGSAALACFVPICPYSFMANRPLSAGIPSLGSDTMLKSNNHHRRFP